MDNDAPKLETGKQTDRGPQVRRRRGPAKARRRPPRRMDLQPPESAGAANLPLPPPIPPQEPSTAGLVTMSIGGLVAVAGLWGFLTLHGDGGLYAVGLVFSLGTLLVGGVIILIGSLVPR